MKDFSKGMVSIIILTKDNLLYTRLCIESIFRNTSLIKTPFEIIVVDNASKDGTVEYLKGLEQSNEVRVIYNKENVGFPKGNNQGAKIAKGEFLCLMNNDVIVTKDWLLNMLRVIRSDPKIAAVGPYTFHSSGLQMVKDAPPYTNDKDLENDARRFNAPTKEVDFLVFFCTLIWRSVWDEVNGLDEEFGMGCYEDNFFCWQLLCKKYKLKVVGHYVHHFGSISWKGQHKDPKKYKAYLELIGRNQKLFFRKIGQYKTVSLSMIVGDYEKPETLKRCLDSVIDYVDAVNIVFTYKWFKNIKKVKRLESIIRQHQWLSLDRGELPAKLTYNIDTKYLKFTDFSDMRNKCLDMATGDYILTLDVDDVMMIPQASRDLIWKNPNVDYFKCHVNSLDEFKQTDVIMQTRLYKNKPEFRYRKPVHEDILLSMKENDAVGVACNLTINHLGYNSVKAVIKKNKRNVYYMTKEIAGKEDDALTYYHLINSRLILIGYARRPKKWKYKQREDVLKYIDFMLDKFKLENTDPLLPKIWVIRGLICMTNGQLTAAKQSLHKAFDEHKHPEAAVNLAEAYMLEKNWDKAIEILDEIYKIENFEIANMPFNLKEIECLMLKKLADCQLHKKNIPLAEKYLREYLSVDTTNLVVIDRLCQILRNTKRMGEANLITVNAVNRFPSYHGGWFNLAQGEMFSERFYTARIFLEHTLKVNPKHKEAQLNLNTINKMLGKK